MSKAKYHSRVIGMYKVINDLGEQVHVDALRGSICFAFDDGDPFFDLYIEEYVSKSNDIVSKWRTMKKETPEYAMISPYMNTFVDLPKLVNKAQYYLMTQLVENLQRARNEELPSVVYDAIPELPCDLLDIVMDYAVSSVKVEYITMLPKADSLDKFYKIVEYVGIR